VAKSIWLSHIWRPMSRENILLWWISTFCGMQKIVEAGNKIWTTFVFTCQTSLKVLQCLLFHYWTKESSDLYDLRRLYYCQHISIGAGLTIFHYIAASKGHADHFWGRSDCLYLIPASKGQSDRFLASLVASILFRRRKVT
jgi:hypothetical protein